MSQEIKRAEGEAYGAYPDQQCLRAFAYGIAFLCLPLVVAGLNPVRTGSDVRTWPRTRFIAWAGVLAYGLGFHLGVKDQIETSFDRFGRVLVDALGQMPPGLK